MLSNGKLEKLLHVPLIKKQSLSRIKTLTTDGFWKYIGSSYDSMMNSLDLRDLTGDENESESDQKTAAYNSINKLGKMYNRFDSQESKEYRNHLIDKYGVGNFEINLDTLTLKYAFENLREQYFNDVLPIIEGAVVAMKFHGYQSGKTEETEEALKVFFDQIKLSIFNISPVKGKEYEKALNVVRAAQRATSFMVLAFRPASLVKELVVGVIKNVSFA